MRDAFIYAPQDVTMESLRAAAASAGYSTTVDPFTIWSGDDDTYVDLSPGPETELFMDEAEKSAARICGPNPTYFALRFRDPAKAAQFIFTLFGEREDVVLDNDHGLLAPLVDLARALRARPAWDWSLAED